MKLRDIVNQAVVKLEIEDEDIFSSKNKQLLNRLIVASNNVIRELASSYLPLVTKERVTIQNGKLDLSKLSRQIVKVISLKDGTYNLRYKMYPTYMYAQNGTYDITYTYLPKEVTIDDEVECDSRVNEDILSNGVVSEYALMIGEIEKGQVFDRKYRENIKNLSVSMQEIKWKGRVFI